MSDALLNRIAALENELRGKKPGMDAAAIKQALITNPIGFYTSLGLSPEEKLHVQRVNFADALGDQAPPDVRMFAALGPQIAQQSQLAATVENLSRQLEALVVAPRKEEATRESLKALIAKKEEYPYLSAAYAANPSLLDSKLKGRTGDAADIAKELEAEAATFATAYGFKPAQPASDNAENTDTQSAQSKPAPLAGAINDVPPLPKPQGGPLTPEEDARIKQDIYRRFPALKPQG